MILNYNNFIIGMQLMLSASKVHSNKSFNRSITNTNNSFFMDQTRTRSLKKNINFSISQLLSATSTEIDHNQEQLNNKSQINMSPIFQKPNFNQKFMMLRRRKHYIRQKPVNQVQKSKRQEQIKLKIKQRIKFQLNQISSISQKTLNNQDVKSNTIRISSSKVLHNNSDKFKNTSSESLVEIKGHTMPFKLNSNSQYKQKASSSLYKQRLSRQSNTFIKKVASFSNTKCKTSSKTQSIRRMQNATMINFQKSMQLRRGTKTSLGERQEAKFLKKKKSNQFNQIQPWDASERLPSIQL